MSQPALFPTPPASLLILSQHFARHVDAKAKYAAYKPVPRVQCEECLWVLHEAKGAGEYPRGARVKRSGNGADIVLCTQHADLWKKREGR